MKTLTLSNGIYAEIERILQRGGLVISPSDTVYGVLVDSTNPDAVQKLIEFKNRPAGKPISIFVSDFRMMDEYADVSVAQELLLKKILPGPFTVILSAKHKTSKLLESEKGTLGLRIPRYPFIHDLVSRYGKPITATSANLSGRSPHYQIRALLDELPQAKKDLIDLIIDGGNLPRNKPSTVIDLTTSTVKTLRKGNVGYASIDVYESDSELRTSEIGREIIRKFSDKESSKPCVFIIEGDLGVGKTVLVKGMASDLGIDGIISPTFVIYYEYKTKSSSFENFYHFDLYNIHESEEFRYLKIDSLLKPKTVLCFEWGEKTGDIIEMLKMNTNIIYITMTYENEHKRIIKVNKQNP